MDPFTRTVSTALIMRRTANYPPEMLNHLGLITMDECRELRSKERDGWTRYYTVLYYR